MAVRCWKAKDETNGAKKKKQIPLCDDGRKIQNFRLPKHIMTRKKNTVVAIFLTPDDVKRGTRITRMMEHERWDRVFSATCVGVPCQLRPNQRDLVRLVVPEAEEKQGVAPVIVMSAVPKVDRGTYVTKRDIVKYGYTDECQACTQLMSGMHNAKVPHDDRCQDRIDELMTGDDDQRS